MLARLRFVIAELSRKFTFPGKLVYGRLSPNIRLFLAYVLLYLLVLFFYRIVFFLKYSYRIEVIDSLLVAKAFLTGFRFDFSVTAMLLLPFLILSYLPVLNRFRVYRIFWGYFPNVVLVWMFAHLIGDIIYFENANKHVGYEAIVMLGRDLPVLLESVIGESWLQFFSAIAVMILYLYVSWNVYRKKFKYSDTQNFQLKLAERVISVIILVIMLRGGLQTSAIRPSYAIISNNSFINTLGLNGVFTSFYDFKSNPIPKFHHLSPEAAAVIVREEIAYPEAEFVNPLYPVLRKTIPSGNGKKPNIILIVQESWSGKFIQKIGDGFVDGTEVAPHYNKLAQEGLLFTKFFAAGGRTTNGLMALLTGIPDRPGISAIHSQLSLATFSGLGNLLKSAGYKTLFITGSDLSFENMEPHVVRWGFDTIVSQSDIEKLGKYERGIWGYHDADVYDLVNGLADKNEGGPFAFVVLTISTHYPYKVPDRRFEIFTDKTRDYEFLNVFHYSDWAISELIRKARMSRYFDDTVFMFVADHSHHRYMNFYEDRSVPLLIYSPKYVRPGVDNRVAGQLDITPTILGLIDHTFYFSAMGKNLLSKQKKDSAYFAYGPLFGWIDNGDFSFINLDADKQSFHFEMTPPYNPNLMCATDQVKCKLNETRARAFLNLGYYLMDKDRIFPALKIK